jgi:hypothetical protein
MPPRAWILILLITDPEVGVTDTAPALLTGKERRQQFFYRGR